MLCCCLAANRHCGISRLCAAADWTVSSRPMPPMEAHCWRSAVACSCSDRSCTTLSNWRAVMGLGPGPGWGCYRSPQSSVERRPCDNVRFKPSGRGQLRSPALNCTTAAPGLLVISSQSATSQVSAGGAQHRLVAASPAPTCTDFSTTVPGGVIGSISCANARGWRP